MIGPPLRCLAAVPCLMLIFDSGWGQETAPLVARVPASPRAFALGNAFVGGAGADVVFYNPAQIGIRPGLFATVARYASASTQAGLASTTALGKVTVGVFGQWLDHESGAFPTRPGALTTRGAFSAQSLVGGLAGAVSVKKFRIGAAAKYLGERTVTGAGGTAAFDVGLSRTFGRFALGLVGQDLGSEWRLDGAPAKLPTRITVGATSTRLPIGTFMDLVATAAVARERGGRIAPSGGLELIYEPVGGWTAALRLGARRVDSGRPSPHPITVGAAVGLDRFALDFGFEGYRGVGSVYRLGFRIE